MLLVEFTVEPFEEGNPGRHVLAACVAIEGLGHHVEVGPFGSSTQVADAEVGRVVGAMLDAAYANGASHVTVTVGRG